MRQILGIGYALVVGLPDTKRPVILRYKWLGDLAAIVPIAAGGVVGVVKVYSQLVVANARMIASDGGRLSFEGLWWIIGGAVVGILVALYKALVARAENAKTNDRESPEDLHGCCLVLHGVLSASDESPTKSGLRITIHRGTGRKKKGQYTQMEQLIPYACSPGVAAGEFGREFPVHCGIIGKVLRLGDPLFSSRVSDTREGFIREMMRDWGYTESEAKDLDETRWSWAAIPLRDSGGLVIGVVYLDSSAKDYFDDGKKLAILAAVESINGYVRRRYK